jgi:high-affinity K+ transport system ATPase subunit B
MRNPVVAIVLLVLLGLVPIGVWSAMASTLDPAGLGRSIGKAILVVLAPLPFAGLLMILGAAMLRRTRRAGRIFATVGAAIVLAGAGALSVMWLARVGRCIEGSSYCWDRMIEGGAGLVYALAHAALIALTWRARESGSANSARAAE